MIIFQQASKTIKYRDLLTCQCACLAPFMVISLSLVMKKNKCNKPVEWDKFCVIFPFIFLMYQDMCWTIISPEMHKPFCAFNDLRGCCTNQSIFLKSQTHSGQSRKGQKSGNRKRREKRDTNIWRGSIKMIEHQLFLIFSIFFQKLFLITFLNLIFSSISCAQYKFFVVLEHVWYVHPSMYWAMYIPRDTRPRPTGRGSNHNGIMLTKSVCGSTILVFILGSRHSYVAVWMAFIDSSMKHMEESNMLLTLVTPTWNMWQDWKESKGENNSKLNCCFFDKEAEKGIW